MNSKIIWLIRFVLGSLFIISALSKLFPIEAFDLTLVKQGIINWSAAPYLSRFIISIELFLGISFFINPFVEKIAIPFSFTLLAVFCIHLIYVIAAGYGSRDCGCFGELFPMSSLTALIKNAALIALLILLKKNYKQGEKLNYSLPFSAFAMVFAAIFLIFQITPYDTQNSNEASISVDDSGKVNYSNEANNQSSKNSTDNQLITKSKVNELQNKQVKSISEFASFKRFNNGQIANLDEGIKLVCLFSLDCEDCMETAYKLGQAKKDWANFPPLYILFLGSEDQVNNFFDAAAMSFPYNIIPPNKFFPLIKDYPPRVVLLNNGNILGDWNYESFSLEELKKKL